MTRVVIDTNVFVSALIGKHGSAADRVLRAFTEDELEVVVSPALLEEFERVLTRPKIRQRAMKRSQGSKLSHESSLVSP